MPRSLPFSKSETPPLDAIIDRASYFNPNRSVVNFRSQFNAMFRGAFYLIFSDTSCEIFNLDAILDLLVVERDRQKSLTSPLHALMNEEISMVAKLSRNFKSIERSCDFMVVHYITRGGEDNFTGRSSTLVIFIFKLCTR